MKPLVAWSLACLLPALAAEMSAQTWVDLSPVAPSARSSHALVYDAARSRTVLFGGSTALGPAGDTWEFDGAAWTQMAPTSPPAARSGHAMVFDSARGRTVLFGGQTATNSLQADTWEYDGVTWTQVMTATSPPARMRHAMAYDSVRGRTVLFGGMVLSGGIAAMAPLGDTWEYDGTNWTLVSSVAWQALSDHAMTYDPMRQRTVLFGGLAYPGTIPASVSRSTREYDGTSWTTIATTTAPSARTGATLVFDTIRGRPVLFGGVRTGPPVSDAWQYDGTNWAYIAPGEVPESRSQHAATFDLASNRMIVFGGLGSVFSVPIELGDTWGLAGSTWHGLVSPPVRAWHSLAYDTKHRNTVLFGGLCNWVSSSDTWEYDGASWHRMNPVTSPSPRYSHALAYHDGLGLTVMFGGVSNISQTAPGLTDTWAFDGDQWHQLVPTVSPSARWGHALAYDMARGCIVLFGGRSSIGCLSDVWELRDGKTWSQVITPTSPSPRVEHALSYDAARCRTVLFGGDLSSAVVFADTWEYDGVTWTQSLTPNSPSPRRNHTLVYDAMRGRVVLFGGLFANCLADQWEYDGSDWTPVVTVGSPMARCGHASAYDYSRGKAVLFGGWDQNTHALADTWAFMPAFAPTWTRHGVGCAGSAGIPTLDAAPGGLPALGSTFALQLNSLPPQPGAALVMFGIGVSSHWGSSPLPVRLDGYGHLNCQLWISPLPGSGTLIAYSGGGASYALSIPNSPALAGLVLSTQALVFDPAAQTRLATLTNAGIMRIF